MRVPETALGLRDALRRGEITAREAVEAHLARVSEREDLGAFVTVTAEAALAEADAADRRRAETAGDAPLHGVPIAHKDLIDVAGAPTTHGSAAVPHRVAEADDPLVSGLRRAGAISLGKTQVPEFGLTAYSENLVAPPARNPLDPMRTPGGSSGGAAAAVAAALLPFSPASDGGGSIRIPALACGLVGLKPGLDAVPSDLARGARDPFGAPKLTVSGPLARDAADAALLFDAMRGAEHEPSLEAVRRAESLTGLRIGASTASPFASAFPVALAPEARRAFELAVDGLLERGHRVDEADIDYDPSYPEAFAVSWTSGLARLEIEAGSERLLSPLTRAFRERALARTDREHREAGSRLRAFAADAAHQWGHYDAVLTPGLTMLPPRVGAFLGLPPDDDYRLQCEWSPYTSMVNVAGLPAVAVPVLRLPSGQAMGVQLIGRSGGEALLLQLAAQLAAGADRERSAPRPRAGYDCSMNQCSNPAER
ncbi:amidase [Leucobacter sp. CSA1]|uniref:Amidase n=1 Tax=Leucobacter chromiisoli TaxID=2796471 RepID=A0A934Q8A8_9MICO|nr:amidase [Leucobacter chromiisoli]MBK0418677.1 amidase [Leucobacter chromiisoli]